MHHMDPKRMASRPDKLRNHRSPPSKTPRTDKVATDGWSGDAAAVPVEFAQKLEREVQRLKAEVKQLRQLLGLTKAVRKGPKKVTKGDPNG